MITLIVGCLVGARRMASYCAALLPKAMQSRSPSPHALFADTINRTRFTNFSAVRVTLSAADLFVRIWLRSYKTFWSRASARRLFNIPDARAEIGPMPCRWIEMGVRRIERVSGAFTRPLKPCVGHNGNSPIPRIA